VMKGDNRRQRQADLGSGGRDPRPGDQAAVRRAGVRGTAGRTSRGAEGCAVSAFDSPGSPGSHPHSHRRNWQPATTIDEYVQNCREGLEKYSDRRAANLLGWTRINGYRAKLMSKLPRTLFECPLAAGVLGTKELAEIALAAKKDSSRAAIERCPHCGEVLRVRGISKRARNAIRAWLADGAP